MTNEQTLAVIKVLLKYIGNDIDQDKALAQGALVILNAMDPNGTTPSMGDEASAEKPKPDPKPRKRRKPFDTGKMKALLDGGWSIAKIADEMGVAQSTIYSHMKSEGIAVGS